MTSAVRRERPPLPEKGSDPGPGEPGGSGDAEADDSDSDTTPPVLLSAEFFPAQVKDGERTTFVAAVNDDLSGVRGVSGVLVSPTGATSGFACRGEGEGNRFVSVIAVPEAAAEGEWTVRQLTLIDQVTNMVTLSRASGGVPQSARFVVSSSSPDTTGPALRNAWMARPSMRGGEENTLFVDATDEKAGVSMVSGAFVSPSKSARLGFTCREGTSAWECPITPPECLDCGLWRLEQLRVQDEANNVTSFRGDDQVVARVQVDIGSERCDSIPPSIVAVSFSPAIVSNAADSYVRVAVTVNDDGCGFGSLSGQLTPPGNAGGQRTFLTVDSAGPGPVFTGRLMFRKQAAKGIWTIDWIQIADKGLNLRVVPKNEPALAKATVRVE